VTWFILWLVNNGLSQNIILLFWVHVCIEIHSPAMNNTCFGRAWVAMWSIMYVWLVTAQICSVHVDKTRAEKVHLINTKLHRCHYDNEDYLMTLRSRISVKRHLCEGHPYVINN